MSDPDHVPTAPGGDAPASPGAATAPASGARAWAGTLAGWVLGGVLLLAVVGKVLNPAAFAQQITAEGLGGLVPASALAVLVLAVEALLGTALVLGVFHPVVLAPAAAMVVAFLGLTGRTYWRSLSGTLPESTGCGCFGYLVERTPAEAFWSDLVLLALPLALIAWSRRGAPRPLARGRLGFAVVVGLATALLAWRAPDLDVDDWATRLAPGVKLGELCAGSAPRVCLLEVVPELGEGRHWVILSALDDHLTELTPMLDEAMFAHEDSWQLWVLCDDEDKDVNTFRWTAGPSFGLRGEVPSALYAPLYRTRPRSFEVVDGVVVRTVSGWPPWLKGNP